MNFVDGLTDLARNRWYRSELIRALRSGPGAASLYFSLFSGLLSLMLCFAFVGEMGTASAAVFLLMLALSGTLIISDLWFYSRNHGLELLRRAARECRRRMSRLRVESPLIFDFLDQLDNRSGLERSFRARPNESIRTVVKALDRLSGTAIRYGPGGKHVFMQNLNSCRVVRLLFDSTEIELISEPLARELRQRLEKVPCYDPEGWSLIFDAAWLNPRD